MKNGSLKTRWLGQLRRWRGETIEEDLIPYRDRLEEIRRLGEEPASLSDEALRGLADSLKARALSVPPDDLVVEVYALVREVAARVLGLRAYDVQILGALALQEGKLIEMRTGEGKTLVAVFPAVLHALSGRGVHILTFNDYLARRDAAWMDPVYRFLGLSVAAVQEGMKIPERQAAYAADITYATAKEAGFDFLRMHLCRRPEEIVFRPAHPFHYAIIDEADSILIDEARIPLVIAGDVPHSGTSPYILADLIRQLREGDDWECDENRRNVFLTDRGLDRLEAALNCGQLHDDRNTVLLTEISQSLHALALLHRDIDYLVRDGRIESIDEFTGRVVDNRRWPDGLQAALEAKEGLEIQPGGRILGSIALQHFLRLYSRLSGMTATAQPAAEELWNFYQLKVTVIPPHRPCRRIDLPDLIFTHQAAKHSALIREIAEQHARGRPVLVGTGSVRESEELATSLREAGIACQVLNAKNDEAEAMIIAGAGAAGAVTISTNMAGRGADIKLGGANEEDRDRVKALGGLLVLGANKHESRRIDDQLRGRAGRQGDPGSSRFFVSLDDPLLVRFGIQKLLPERLLPSAQEEAIGHRLIQREVARLQRIVEGQNYEIRKTLWSYSSIVEKQRRSWQEWRMDVLPAEEKPGICSKHDPTRYAALVERHGAETIEAIERRLTLHHLDRAWADHLAYIAQVRESINLVGLSGRDPLYEYHKLIAEAFWRLSQTVEQRIVETFFALRISEAGVDWEEAGVSGGSATWTYLINDRALGGLSQMLFGAGNTAFAMGAVLSTWPLLMLWKLRKRFYPERPSRH